MILYTIKSPSSRFFNNNELFEYKKSEYLHVYSKDEHEEK
jgi:hypothetical protein